MSLSIKGKIVDSSDCLSFYWEDTTGVYTDSNTGGFNSPNPTIAQVTGATLAIINSSGDTITFSDGEGFYPLMPNTNGSRYQITSAMFGGSADSPITDLITLATYTVNVGDDSYIFSEYVLIGCQSKCCIAKMNAAVDFSNKCAPCDNKKLQTYLKAQALLDAIYNSLACSPQLPNKAAADLTTLTELCLSNNCGCGCN